MLLIENINWLTWEHQEKKKLYSLKQEQNTTGLNQY